eukprot:1828660-Amphidinium_carterae.1
MTIDEGARTARDPGETGTTIKQPKGLFRETVDCAMWHQLVAFQLEAKKCTPKPPLQEVPKQSKEDSNCLF